MALYGLQHVLSMYAGVVAVPLIFESGISAAAIAAIVLNIVFNYRRGQLDEAPIFAEAPPIGTTFEGDVEGIVTEGDPPPTRPIHPHRPDAH